MTIEVTLDDSDESNSELLQQQGEQCSYCGRWFLRHQPRKTHEAQCESNPDGHASATVVESERMPDEPPYYITMTVRGDRAYHANPDCHKIPDGSEVRERGAEMVAWRDLRKCSNCVADGGDT